MNSKYYDSAPDEKALLGGHREADAKISLTLVLIRNAAPSPLLYIFKGGDSAPDENISEYIFLDFICE